MAYFSRLTDMSFRTDSEGRIVFFPWGYFGKGYILRDKSQEMKIRKSITTGNIIGLSLVFIIGVILKLWLVGLLLLPFVIVIWSLLVKGFTKGLEISTLEYSVQSNTESNAVKVDKATWALRISIIVQWGLIVVAVAIGLFEERYFTGFLKNYANEQASKSSSSSEAIVMGAGLILFIIVFISSIGIYRLKPWARTAYVTCSLLGFVLFMFMEPSVTPPIGGAFQDLATATEGFTIALLYLSTAREHFESSNLNAREGR